MAPFDEPPVDEEQMEPVDDLAEESAEPAPMPEPAAAAKYQAMPNLAATLPLAYLKKVAARVLSDAESDYRSTEQWRSQVADFYKLYAGDPADSIPDQKNITLVNLPYLRRSARMFHSKMFPALYPPTKELLALAVGSPSLQGIQDVADRCALHMNHQLYNECVEYIPSHDRGMTQNLIEGVIYEVWMYDSVQERPRQEICLAEDVWISYRQKADRADLADVPRITWRRRMHQHELEAEEAAGYYIGITQPIVGPAGPDGESTETMQPLFPPEDSYDEAGAPKYAPTSRNDTMDDRPVKEQADREMGQEEQDPSPDGAREILEQDRWLKLPGETRQRAVTICMDRDTLTIVRLSYREREDLVDKRRHVQETQQWQAAMDSQTAMFQSSMQQWQDGQQPLTDVDPMTGQMMEMPGPMQGQPPPSEPPPLPEPAPVKMTAWHRWTKYDCTMNPIGALGHGLPQDVAGHNILANKVATRAISQMTLNMLPTGIASRQSRFARGETQLKLGEISESPLSPSQVQAGAGMFFLQFPPVSPDWYKAVEMADQSCQEVTAFDIAAGGPGLSGESATESEMRHSNATDNISEVAQRYNRGRSTSLKNLAYINSITLPDEGAVVYRAGKEVRVFREDYEAILESLEIIFTCDPNLESKVIKAKKAERLFTVVNQAIGQGVAGMPALDPGTSIMLIRAATAMMLKASEAPPEWVDAIMAAPMPNQPPPATPPGEKQNGQGPQTGNGPPGSGAAIPPQNAPGPMAAPGTGGPPQ